MGADSRFGATIGELQEELPQIESRLKQLQTEAEELRAKEGAVRAALDSLRSLQNLTAPGDALQEAVAQATRQPEPAKVLPVKKASTTRKAVGSNGANGKGARKAAKPLPAPRHASRAAAQSAAARRSGTRRRTGVSSEQVHQVLLDSNRPLRAREVIAQLGLEESVDKVNSIRTMLERLAKAGRAHRPGRGLYAPQTD